MKRIFSAFLAFIIALSLVSCTSRETPQTSSEASDDGTYIYPVKDTSMSVGTAGKLEGRCLAASVFISRDGAGWTGECIKHTLDKLEDAAAFLEKEAALYGVNLDIVTDTYQTAGIFAYGLDDTSLRNFAWTNAVFDPSVQGGIDGYVNGKYDTESFDSYLVVFHVIADERSYAVDCDTAYSDCKDYETERCVVFHTHDEDYEYADTPYTYAHELLHLFGAEDLYFPVITEENEAAFKALFPNDMMCGGNDIELLSVSPYTAWRIGWIDGLEKDYDFLID